MRKKSICSLCEAHCGIEVEVEGSEIVAIHGDKEDPLSRGYICPKGLALKDLHDDPDRLRAPLRKTRGGWEQIAWEEALELAAERLHRVREAHGRHALAVYVGNPTVHSYSTMLTMLPFLKSVRSHNRYSATSADQLPHMFAGLHMFGHQLLMPVPDLERCDFLVVIGGNPCASNGSILTAPNIMARLRKIRDRGRVLVIDPRRTETARLAGEHLAIRPGRDPLLLLALLSVMDEEGLIQPGPWQGYSDGLEQVRALARRFPPERVGEAVGIPAPTIRALARDFVATPRAAFYGRIGICTQPFGGLNAWLLNLVNLLGGKLDRPGGMMFTAPAADLVALAARMGNRGSFGRWKTRVRGLPEFGGEAPVSTLADEIETPGPEQIRALVTIAGNPVLSTPNGARLERALPQLDFMVSLDMYLGETSRHADLILPPLSHLERDAYSLAFNVFAIRNIARYNGPVVPPPAGALDDWQVLLELAARLEKRAGSPRSTINGFGFDLMRRLGPARLLDLTLRTGPYGAGIPVFGDLMRTLRGQDPGLSLAALEKHPAGIDLGPLQPCLPERLGTPDKRVRLAPEVLLADAERLDELVAEGSPEGLLLIGRRHLRSNNSWLHNAPRLMKGKARHILLMHPEDADARDIADGDRVTVSSRVGKVEVAVELDTAMMPGVVSLPHGWGHHREGTRLRVAGERPGVSANDLTDERFLDPLTATAGLNGVPVEVAKVGALAAAEA